MLATQLVNSWEAEMRIPQLPSHFPQFQLGRNPPGFFLIRNTSTDTSHSHPNHRPRYCSSNLFFSPSNSLFKKKIAHNPPLRLTFLFYIYRSTAEGIHFFVKLNCSFSLLYSHYFDITIIIILLGSCGK